MNDEMETNDENDETHDFNMNDEMETNDEMKEDDSQPIADTDGAAPADDGGEAAAADDNGEAAADDDDDGEGGQSRLAAAMKEKKRLMRLWRENDGRFNNTADRHRIGHDEVLRVKPNDDGTYRECTAGEKDGRIMSIVAWWLYKARHLT